MSDISVELAGPPTVWADTVQELCEALPYFRSYQSGLYKVHGIAISILLNGSALEREDFNWDVIVTHGIGSMEPMNNQATGSKCEYRLKRSQENTVTGISPLIKSYSEEKPVVVF